MTLDKKLLAHDWGKEFFIQIFRMCSLPLDLSQVDYVQYGDSKIPVNAG